MWKAVLRATCEISKEGRCDWLAMSATGTEMMLCNIYQVFVILELFALNCHSRSSIQWLVTLFPHILSSLLLHWHLCIILCFPFTAWYIFITLSYPLQHSCLENPVDSRAWWAAVYGVAQSWTRLKRLSSSSSGIVDSWRGLGACLERLVQDWIHKVNTQKVSTRYGLIC